MRCLRLCLLLAWFTAALAGGSAYTEEPAAEVPAPAAAAAAAEDAKPDEDYYELYKTFADTLDQVERNYVEGISRRELMEAAIEGVLSKLDPHSNYINQDEINQFKAAVESQFGGIGIQITIDEGALKVLSPLVGTPAYRAGLHAGDHITQIDGQPTAGINVDDAVKRLKGEAGTSVTLTVAHPGKAELETVTIVREIILIETVLGDRHKLDDTWDFVLDQEKRIGYIRISGFSRDTARNVEKALKELESQKFTGLIVDLRFNPGGLLTSAIEISDLFVAEGAIVSTEGRNSAKRSWDAREPGTFMGFPMAVLVNRYSASASEIVSACLQDHKRAVIIGERTYGKGSVQNVIELEGGKTALKLTTASYQRPNGKNIHRFPDAKDTDEWGVVPDDGYLVQLSDSEMLDLVKYRRDRDILHAPAEATPEAAPAPAAPEAAPAEGGFTDRQLQKAIEYLTTEVAAAK